MPSRPLIEWRWTRRSITTVVVVMLVVACTAFLIKFAQDHDGETVTFGADPVPASPSAETGDLDPVSGLPWIREDELPLEGQATLASIDRSGPFPYDQDGAVFHNLEGILPSHEDGYYREYTVITPGSTDRGARRIVTGSGDEYYWTQDHYASFERILRRSS